MHKAIATAALLVTSALAQQSFWLPGLASAGDLDQGESLSVSVVGGQGSPTTTYAVVDADPAGGTTTVTVAEGASQAIYEISAVITDPGAAGASTQSAVTVAGIISCNGVVNQDATCLANIALGSETLSSQFTQPAIPLASLLAQGASGGSTRIPLATASGSAPRTDTGALPAPSAGSRSASVASGTASASGSTPSGGAASKSPVAAVGLTLLAGLSALLMRA